MDDSSTQHAGGIGVVLQSPEGDKLKYKIRLQYQPTNNEVEYEALLKGLELAKSMEARSILIPGDFQLVISQINGMYEAKEGRMKKYLEKVLRLAKKFKEINFVQIPREENMEADALVKEASVTGVQTCALPIFNFIGGRLVLLTDLILQLISFGGLQNHSYSSCMLCG